MMNQFHQNHASHRGMERKDRETARRLTQELRGDGPTAQFARRAMAGNLDRPTIDLAVHGGNAAFVHQQGDMTLEHQLTRYAERLTNEARDFWERGLNLTQWHQGAANPDAVRTAAQRAVQDNAVDHVIEASPGHPPQHLGHPNEVVNRVFDNHHQSAMRQFGHRHWEMIPRILEYRSDEATTYRDTGQLPPWLDPDVFPPEAFALSPALRRAGHTAMHNEPIDVFDRPENIQHYLKRQMDAHVSGPDKYNLSQHPAEFARALLAPELDPALSASWNRFDAEDSAYVDDGPVNYCEADRIMNVVEGDTSHPQSHFETTYARMIRDALMYKGLADDAYMNRPDLLALSYPRNVLAMRQMSEFAHAAIRQHQAGGWERPEMPGYNPPVKWTNTPQENLDAALGAMEYLAGVRDLKNMIEATYESIQPHFDPQDAADHDSPMKISSFYQGPEDPGDRRIDIPSAILLREAVGDMRTALEFAGLAIQARLQNDAPQAAEGGRPAAEQDDTEGNIPLTPEDEDRAVQDQRANQSQLISRAIDRMTHADFCITMARRAAEHPAYSPAKR